MALIAHWPLNGNTNDISGNKNALINNGTTFVSNGKIGQAVDFDGSTTRSLTTTDGNFSTETFSISFWAFYDDYTYPKTMGAIKKSTGNTFSAGTIGWDFGHGYVASGVRTTINDGANLIDTSVTFDVGYRPTDFINKWVHLSFIVDRNFKKVKYYVNGIKQSYELDISSITGTISSSNNLVFGTLYGWISDSRFNDLRIYDHALTDMEVQEIARAKILHYTFDDMQEPTTNLKYNPSANDWINSGTWTRNGNETDVAKPFPNDLLSIWSGVVLTTGSIHFGYNVTTVSPSTVYTISVWFRQNRAGASAPYMRTNVNNNSLGNFSYNGNTNSASWPVNEWIRISASFTTQANENGIYLSNYIGTQVGDKIWYYGYQVEQKDHVTDYVYGSRTGKVNDYSGFFNHSDAMTEVNTPRWISEAKIGTGAYQFNGTTSLLKTLSPKAYIPAAMDYTQSIWIYQTSRPARQVIFDDNNQWEHWIALNTNGTIYAAYYVDATTGQIAVTSTNAISLNTWYHIALSVISGVSMKLYVNGVLWAERTIDGYHSKIFNDFIIGSNGGANAEKLIGYLDDARLYSKALTQDEIIDLYNTRAEAEQSGVLYARDLLSNAEETVNLITRRVDSYPSIGMGHRTYSADSAGTYNNGTAYSIGNIVSISDNILTVDGTGKALYTYDCIYPTTTGGGLSSSIEYFIKKHGTNQYSFHTYNGSDDGSQTYIDSETGGFYVHHSVDTDTRIAINLTNFPTSWKGNPHKANQSMVKQVIPNGFNYRGRVHDCVRIVTSHRHPDPINSYMAYGVYPQVTAGKYYTFSFYIRAVNDAAVGKNIQMTLWTSGGWSGGTYAYTMPITKEWKRYVMYALAPNTGGTNMYFPGISSGGDAEIAEIQCEEGIKVTEFTTTYRPASQLPSTIEFGADEVHETGTANFEDFSTVGITDGLIGYWPLNNNAKDYSGNNYHGTVSGALPVSDYYSFDAVDDYITVPNGMTYTNGFSISVFINPINAGENGYGRIVDKTNSTGSTNGFFLYMNNSSTVIFGVNNTSLQSLTDTTPYNTWTHIIATIDNLGAAKIYINGVLNNTTTLSVPSNITTTNLLTIGNRSTATDRTFYGFISDLKIFNRILSPEEIAIEYNTMFNNQVQIHESGVLYAKDIIQY